MLQASNSTAARLKRLASLLRAYGEQVAINTCGMLCLCTYFVHEAHQPAVLLAGA